MYKHETGFLGMRSILYDVQSPVHARPAAGREKGTGTHASARTCILYHAILASHPPLTVGEYPSCPPVSTTISHGDVKQR